MKSQSVVDSIRERVDIVDVIREYIPALKKAGRNFKACCPFHGERTPSFTVSQEKQMYYCFGCQEGGDVFKFVMKMDNSGFAEAARKLADRAGIEWKASDRLLGPQEKERLRIKEALEFACGFYSRELSSKAGEGARKYLSSRKVSPEILEKFEVGFAPAAGFVFVEAASKAGYSAEILQKAGLATRWQDGRLRDYFRGRVLFPIRNARNEVTGFGGRILGEGEPKYLNSPDTPVFSKGKALYGIAQAVQAARKKGEFILLEGYMDVLAVHQFGIERAVAPLGTALTADHCRFIKRYADNAILLFDPDEAGIRASIKGAGLLIEAGIFVKVGSLGSLLDPDEFLHKHGRDAFEKVLSGAEDLIEFQTAALVKGRGPSLRPDEKAKAASVLLETISKQPDPIIRQEWVKHVAGKLNVTENALYARLEKKKAPFAGPSPASAPAGKEIPPLELDLIHLLLKQPGLIKQAESLSEKDFQSPSCWKVFLAVEGLSGAGAGWISRLLEMFPEESAWLARLSVEELNARACPEKDMAVYVKRMRRFSMEKRWEALKKRIAELSEKEKAEFHQLSLALKSSRNNT